MCLSSELNFSKTSEYKHQLTAQCIVHNVLMNWSVFACRVFIQIFVHWLGPKKLPMSLYLDSCNCFYRKQQKCKNITRYMGILLKRHLAKVYFVFRYFFCLLFLPTIFGLNRIFGLWWCWWWWYWLLNPDVSRARCNKCNFGFSQRGLLTIPYTKNRK